MKRYRLKKDLPTFEAGQVCWLGLDGQLLTQDEEGEVIVMYSAKTMVNFPKILTDWFEEIPEETKTVWELEEGDLCYVIQTAYSSIESIETFWNKTWVPDRSVGGVFLTKKEAEKEIARRKAKQILLRDTKGFRPDWNDSGQNKTLVYYDSGDKKMKVVPWSVNAMGGIYFASQADTEASIKAHPEEWKTYLGVEE